MRVVRAIVGLPAIAQAVGLVALLVASGGPSYVRPDPAVPDGDPCCGHPDTWGDVVEGAAAVVGIATLSAGLASFGVASLAFAATGRRRERWWPWLATPLAVGAVLAAWSAIAILRLR
jgi:hypothetical protein